MVLYCLVRRDRTRSSVYDAPCCPELYPPTVEGAGLRFEAAVPEPAATYERAPDEHGRLVASAATSRLGLDDKVCLIPGHCDPTVTLCDWHVCVRGDRFEQVWPNYRKRCGVLTFGAGQQPPEGEPTWCGSEPIDQPRPSVTTP